MLVERAELADNVRGIRGLVDHDTIFKAVGLDGSAQERQGWLLPETFLSLEQVLKYAAISCDAVSGCRGSILLCF